MDQLVLALQARVPVVSVKTDDLVFFPQVLSHIVGANVPQMSEGALKGPSQVLYTGAEVTPQVWSEFKQLGKTLVCVNAKKSVLHLDCGSLFPPKDMMVEYLGHFLGELGVEVEGCELPDLAAELVQSFGGLTIKEAYEVLKMVVQKAEGFIDKINVQEVNAVRQGLLSKAKGITQVKVDDELYCPPDYLQGWLHLNKQFFLNPPHPSLTPRGLLFDGPPGTGKTAGAMYIAREFGLPLYRLDIGGMKGKYVGDSEGALQSALTQIDQAAPCVVLMDEIEKTFQTEGDKGVTSSMLGALLWWLQEHRTQVFTVMTTNAKTMIPKELFREGRIDSVLTFEGLESHAELKDFAAKVWEAMAAKAGVPDAKMKPIPLGVELPMAQVKVVTACIQELKQQIAGGKK